MTSAPPGTVCLITPDPALDLWFPPELGDEQPSDPDVNDEQILVPVSLPCVSIHAGQAVLAARVSDWRRCPALIG